jgi:hypothetical protein
MPLPSCSAAHLCRTPELLHTAAQPRLLQSRQRSRRARDPCSRGCVCTAGGRRAGLHWIKNQPGPSRSEAVEPRLRLVRSELRTPTASRARLRCLESAQACAQFAACCCRPCPGWMHNGDRAHRRAPTPCMHCSRWCCPCQTRPCWSFRPPRRPQLPAWLRPWRQRAAHSCPAPWNPRWCAGPWCRCCPARAHRSGGVKGGGRGCRVGCCCTGQAGGRRGCGPHCSARTPAPCRPALRCSP